MLLFRGSCSRLDHDEVLDFGGSVRDGCDLHSLLAIDLG
jgi:hypothetical protein